MELAAVKVQCVFRSKKARERRNEKAQENAEPVSKKKVAYMIGGAMTI